ncbi:hypothetical protein [Asanoa siamensis]|uniref:GLTT repeat-containing protein n=1 Tax=Asanoa siamensis TaxID=926357 RepID=A0ABQ4D0L1_9ACTN|nr:hypothetical protein [Asanoa siamensis]GIF77079.1 hypothetical protein Asi02nite_65970 [Asanoa siamensis]
MTKWIYRAVGTVGVAAGGALLLAGGPAQADGIDAPVNDLRGSLDGFFTPMGDVAPVPAGELAPGQHLGFLGAVPNDPAAGVDPAALEAGPPTPTLNTDNLTLLGVGDKQITMNTLTDAVNSTGPLVDDKAGGQLLKGSAQPGSELPVIGGSPLGDSPLGALGLGPTEAADDPLTGALGNGTTQVGRTLSDDNLNTIGSDSQMRTLGSTVGADQLSLDQLGRGSGLGGGGLGGNGLGDLNRGGGLGSGPLGELADDPLGAVGKHAAPDQSDFDIADLRGTDLDGLGQSLVPPLIGEALEAEMPPGFLGGSLEADGDSMIGLPLVGQLPLSALNTTDPNGALGNISSIDALGGGPSSGGTAQPAASSSTPTPAPKQQLPAVSPTADDGGNNQRGHRQWSRSKSERPVAGEDLAYR